MKDRFSQSRVGVGFWFALTGLLALPASGQACAVCFGDPEAPMTQAISWGILFLGALVGLVLGTVGAFAVFLVRRGKRHPITPSEGAIESVGAGQEDLEEDWEAERSEWVTVDN